jgi:hypothetical protein
MAELGVSEPTTVQKYLEKGSAYKFKDYIYRIARGARDFEPPLSDFVRDLVKTIGLQHWLSEEKQQFLAKK